MLRDWRNSYALNIHVLPNKYMFIRSLLWLRLLFQAHPSPCCMFLPSSSLLGGAREEAGEAALLPQSRCVACGRTGSSELCLASRGNPDALEEVCISCYLCEHLQELGARLDERSGAYRLHIARLSTAYQALRAALPTGPLEEPPSSDDASERR